MNKLHDFSIVTGKYFDKGERTTAILANRFYGYELTKPDKNIDLFDLRLFFDNGEKLYTKLPYKNAEHIILNIAKKQKGGWLKRFVRWLW